MPARSAPADTFAVALRHHRARRKLTQRALADAAGLHWNYVARLESGDREPSFEVACRLADALKISVAHFREPKKP
jgi:transcriptional regulator with XRE-family HTH domain